MDRVVLLSGEHPSLPLAELQALLAVHAPGAHILALTPTMMRVQHEDPSAVDEAVRRMALAHSWSEYWGHATGEEALMRLHERIRDSATGEGSIAVRAKRAGPKVVSAGGIERSLGAALAQAGHTIDLDAPDMLVTAWLNQDTLVVGKHLGSTRRGTYDSRRVTDREHFSPITLHPRRAASLVHLGRAPPAGLVYDPFCGTGGLLLEAALEGYQIAGSDLDPWMVQGTCQSLADNGPEPLPGLVFRADVGLTPELIEDVDAIVTDLPYGQASTTDGEDLLALYQRAFDAFAALLDPGSRLVFGCAEKELGEMVDMHGFTIEEHHQEFVHKSMTRHYFVARRT